MAESTEITGEDKKHHLIDLRRNIIEIRKQTQNSLEIIEKSILPKENFGDFIKDSEKYFKKSGMLIEILERQLEAEFNFRILDEDILERMIEELNTNGIIVQEQLKDSYMGLRTTCSDLIQELGRRMHTSIIGSTIEEFCWATYIYNSEIIQGNDASERAINMMKELQDKESCYL